jgi:hypothetical protein
MSVYSPYKDKLHGIATETIKTANDLAIISHIHGIEKSHRIQTKPEKPKPKTTIFSSE